MNNYNNIKISVIIPVYNAENYVREAVVSAVNLNNTGEIILIDDGSVDKSLTICMDLEREFDTVRVFTHPNSENRGVSASRNLGIKLAKYDYIAFLDADDKYLPNRFDTEIELFKDVYTHGVYGATLAFYENEVAKQQFLTKYRSSLTTINKVIQPNDLFKTLLWQHDGWFTMDAITLHRTVFDKVGFFNEKLSLGEDTEFWYRVSSQCTLVGGSIIKPIALRRVHDTNHIHASKEAYETQMRIYFLHLAKEFLVKKNISYDNQNNFFMAANSYRRIFTKELPVCLFLFKLISLMPQLLISDFFWRKLKQLVF